MENKVKRIGYLPRKRVLEIIDEISKSESISRSKVVGILVEEALDARGIANFGYSNTNNLNLYKSDNFLEINTPFFCLGVFFKTSSCCIFYFKHYLYNFLLSFFSYKYFKK